MKRSLLILSAFLLIFSQTKATTHVVQVWDGYFQFIQPESPFVVELGDTIQWVPLDTPSMTHTITSTDIPDGAMTFDYIWQAPDNLFFQYVPTVAGQYDYVCTPHETNWGMVGSFTVNEGTLNTSEVGTGTAKIDLFPNPTSDLLSIDLSNLESQEWTIHLMDHAGRQMEVLFQGTILSNSQTVVRSLRHLPSGVYFVLLEADGVRRTKRIVKK